MATPGQIQEVAKHYVIAALWTDSEEGTHPRCPAKTHAVAFDFCKRFIDRNNDLFNEAMECAKNGYGAHPDAGSAEAAFGHDLWLTTQGHGVGFWDREKEGMPEKLGLMLSEACREFEGQYSEIYRGWLYFHGA